MGLHLHSLPLPHGAIVATDCHPWSVTSLRLPHPLDGRGTSLRSGKQYGGKTSRHLTAVLHTVDTDRGVLPPHLMGL